VFHIEVDGFDVGNVSQKANEAVEPTAFDG